jgi:hypothetical protein
MDEEEDYNRRELICGRRQPNTYTRPPHLFRFRPSKAKKIPGLRLEEKQHTEFGVIAAQIFAVLSNRWRRVARGRWRADGPFLISCGSDVEKAVQLCLLLSDGLSTTALRAGSACR